MLNYICKLTSLILLVTISSLAQSESLVTQQYAIKQVVSLDVQGAGKLFVTQGDTESLQIIGSKEALENVKVDQTIDKLTLRSESGKHFFHSLFSMQNDSIEYHLVLKDLNELKLSGAVNGTVGSFKTKKLQLDLSGAVNLNVVSFNTRELRTNASGAVNLKFDSLSVGDLDVDLSGACNLDVKDASRAEKINFHASGATNIRAGQLAGNVVYADASGSSHIEVQAEQILDVHASGIASVQYKGNPRVSQSVSGASHVGSF